MPDRAGHQSLQLSWNKTSLGCTARYYGSITLFKIPKINLLPWKMNASDTLQCGVGTKPTKCNSFFLRFILRAHSIRKSWKPFIPPQSHHIRKSSSGATNPSHRPTEIKRLLQFLGSLNQWDYPRPSCSQSGRSSRVSCSQVWVRQQLGLPHIWFCPELGDKTSTSQGKSCQETAPATLKPKCFHSWL